MLALFACLCLRFMQQRW